MRLWFKMLQEVQQAPYRIYTELAGIRIFVTRLLLDKYFYIYMQVLELQRSVVTRFDALKDNILHFLHSAYSSPHDPHNANTK